jgi:hypothetical protein
MEIDIRDKENITHEDILRLNFVKRPSRYFFRKHFREGLRSRLMQVLHPKDVEAETKGVFQQSIQWFPLAKPLKMLRIFKERFKTSAEVQQEIHHFKIVQRYLPLHHYAVSQEFIVSYFSSGKYDLLLCGLQEFVEGESLDPWRENSVDRLRAYFSSCAAPQTNLPALLETVKAAASSFVEHIKLMIQKAACIPDLSGTGNIRITGTGCMKLVDINNISRVSFDHHIRLDDKGYPACDKSIQALSKIEQHLLGRRTLPCEPIYQLFLDPHRLSHVKSHEKRFHESTSATGNYPRLAS